MNTIQDISIEKIIVTGLNDRTVFNPESQKELTDSIKKHGIIQNLVVRKNGKPGHFELVAGERRLIAAKAAGLEEVPCSIRELNDTEFKELMLIENLQREDIHPMDEAFGYKRLLDDKQPEKEIALKVGKTVKYIKQRIALVNLCNEAVNLFRENVMQLGHAQILCLFSEEQQLKAVENVMRGDKGFAYFDHPIDLKAWMNQHILQKLSDAVFDVEDEKLIKKAGKCSICHKQTGYNTELFACVSVEAQCMDKECFENKTIRHIDLNNKKFLKQFKLKREDCPSLTKDYYSYDGELCRGKWVQVESADECVYTSVGFLQQYNMPEVAILACVNQKCKEHFEQKESESKSAIPENETKSESFERKMKNRREKQLREDTHAARKVFLETVADVKENSLISFELIYLAQIMISRSNGRAYELATEMGFEKDENAWFWQDDFIELLKTKDVAAISTFIRTLILKENLNEDDRYILSRNKEEDQLLQHGNALNIDFEPILKEKMDARLEIYANEEAELEEIKLKEKERAEKIQTLIKKCNTEYMELYRVIKAEDREQVLSKLKLEELSKMAFRLGLKRKKDGDEKYYTLMIMEGLKELTE